MPNCAGRHVLFPKHERMHAGPPQVHALLRKMWLAPSQMAQAEMPLLQNTSSLGMPSRLASAPVATINPFVRTCRCSLVSSKTHVRREARGRLTLAWQSARCICFCHLAHGQVAAVGCKPRAAMQDF